MAWPLQHAPTGTTTTAATGTATAAATHQQPCQHRVQDPRRAGAAAAVLAALALCGRAAAGSAAAALILLGASAGLGAPGGLHVAAGEVQAGRQPGDHQG